MVKKVLFISLILSGVVLFVTAGQCFADAAGLLEQAKKTEEQGYHEQAESVYKTIVADYPGSVHALKARKGLVLLYIWEQKGGAAQAELDKLVADYPGHSALPVVLYDIARRYEWFRRHKEAKNIYQQIIQQYPGSPSAQRARLDIPKALILRSIEGGDYTEVPAAVAQLSADFADNPYLPTALYKLAAKYEWFREYEKAKGIYQQVIPRSADMAQMDIAKGQIILSIEAGDGVGAQAGIAKLMTDFPGRPYLPNVLCIIAKEYERSGEYDKAESIHEQVIQLKQQHPDGLYAKTHLHIRRGRVMALIDAGDDAGAMAAVAQLIADYPGSSFLPDAVYRIAKCYSKKAVLLEDAGRSSEAREHFTRAAALLERAISELAASNMTVEMCCSAGACERKLGNYEKSIGYYQKVVDDYPGHYRAWYAQLSVAFCYEALEGLGRISKADAAVQIRDACERVLTNYPDCPMVDKAANILRLWDVNSQ